MNNSILNKHSITIFANYLLVLYAFLLPISNQYSKYTLTLILISFFFIDNFKAKLMGTLQNRFVQAILLFYFMHILWLIGTDNLDIAVFKIREFKYLFSIVIFVTILKDEFKEKVLSSFIYAVLFSELVSYLMFFNILPSFISIKGYSQNVPFMEAYTQYAVILSISLGLICFRLLEGGMPLYKKIIYSIFFVSATVNIFTIHSKLGYGLYTISILTVLIYYNKERLSLKRLLFVTIGIIGIYVVAFQFSQTFQKKISSITTGVNQALYENKYQNSTSMRLGWWIYGYQIFKEHPLFGVGTGDHLQAMRLIVDKDKDPINRKKLSIALTSGGNGSLHSEYLDNVIQFGLIGLFVFLSIFFYLYKNNPRTPLLNVLKILIVIIFLVNSTVSLIFIHSQLGKIFLLLASLIVSNNHSISKNKKIN